MAKLRLAFLGFRHGHVMGLYQSALRHPRVEVVAACEEDVQTAAELRAAGVVKLTHGTFDELFAGAELNTPGFDAVAVGDYFGRRGAIILRALQAGKHVIVDKPTCTRLEELEHITALAAEKKRVIGCLLDLRDHGPFITLRRLIRGGAIGEVRTVTITAQHPLLRGKRPGWYFETEKDGGKHGDSKHGGNKHGGTLNDIGIHAVDLIPWLTGRRIVEATAARAWNARLPQFPHFQDAAQMMLKLDNGGGVMSDLSYLAADGVGYGAPQYWRVTCHGDGGVAETSYNATSVSLAKSADTVVQNIPAESHDPTGCLDAFLGEIEGGGKRNPGALTTRDVLDASRRTLLIQWAADEGKSIVSLD